MECDCVTAEARGIQKRESQMAFLFQPGVYRDGSIYLLPRPVTRFRVSERWDYQQFKVPLKAGDVHVGHSRDGIDLLIEGQFGSQDGDLKLSEEAMFDALEALRSSLDVTSDNDKFEFFTYYDSDSTTYRKYKNCSAVRLEFDLSSPHLFTYSATLHADDSTIHSTAPGV